MDAVISEAFSNLIFAVTVGGTSPPSCPAAERQVPGWPEPHRPRRGRALGEGIARWPGRAGPGRGRHGSRARPRERVPAPSRPRSARAPRGAPAEPRVPFPPACPPGARTAGRPPALREQPAEPPAPPGPAPPSPKPLMSSVKTPGSLSMRHHSPALLPPDMAAPPPLRLRGRAAPPLSRQDSHRGEAGRPQEADGRHPRAGLDPGQPRAPAAPPGPREGRAAPRGCARG